nr:hypothetical protein [Deltaproteobacteria bacterium]
MKIRSLLGATAVLMGMAIPATAGAQVRVTGLAGVDWMNRAPTSLSLRAEGTLSPIPWLHVGAYATSLSALEQSGSGYSVGGLAALRPGIPGTSVDPMAFVSLGYQRTPGETWERGAVLQVGGGLVFHTLPFLDLELRAAYVQSLESSDSNGLTAAVGLSLHP